MITCQTPEQGATNRFPSSNNPPPSSTAPSTMNSMPVFPDLIPSTTFSFTSAYSHEIASVPSSSTARRPRSNSTNRRRPARRGSDQNNNFPESSTNGALNGARRDNQHNAHTNGQAVTRARTRRILLGERQAGTQLTRESEELSDQEEAVYHAEASALLSQRRAGFG
jgi:hypothetical protein